MITRKNLSIKRKSWCKKENSTVQGSKKPNQNCQMLYKAHSIRKLMKHTTVSLRRSLERKAERHFV